MILTFLLALTVLLSQIGEVVECNHLQIMKMVCAACGCSEETRRAQLENRTKSRTFESDLGNMTGDINLPTLPGWSTALHVAAAEGDLQKVEDLLAGGAVVDLPNKQGLTALHLAGANNRQDVMKVLLQHEANVNGRTSNGSTLLHLAALNRNLPAVGYILGIEGVMISVKDNAMETPLDIARRLNSTEVAQALEHKIAELDAALIAAADKGLLENVADLIARGASVNAMDDSMATPLHKAAINGHLELANRLIRMGADVNSRTNDGSSPLHLAINRGQWKVVDALMQQKNIHVNS